MQQYNIHNAKTHLSTLVEKAAAGDSFIIAKAGKPMVKVIPMSAQKTIQRVGFLKGQIKVPAYFDKLGKNKVINSFEGSL